jgi:hypothetical protein
MASAVPLPSRKGSAPAAPSPVPTAEKVRAAAPPAELAPARAAPVRARPAPVEEADGVRDPYGSTADLKPDPFE